MKEKIAGELIKGVYPFFVLPRSKKTYYGLLQLILHLTFSETKVLTALAFRSSVI